MIESHRLLEVRDKNREYGMSSTFKHSYCLKFSLPLASVTLCSLGYLTTPMIIPSHYLSIS